MNRRDFLKGSAAAMATAGGLAAPSLATTAGTKLLKFVPQTNLANLDPIWGTQYVVRNASLLIWDTLYGVDSKLDPKPQMAEGHEVTDDGRTGTLKLRAGLKFHDGEPVLSRDVIASLTRWMARDTMGQMIKARLDALEALDDRTFRFRLEQAFHEDAAGARQIQFAGRLHYAGADRQNRSVQAHYRDRRLRPDEISDIGMGGGFARGVRKVRWLRAPAGSFGLAGAA